MYLVYLQSAFAFLLSFGEINIDTVVCDVIPHPSLYFNHFRTWLELHIFHYFVLIHKTLKLKVDVGFFFFLAYWCQDMKIQIDEQFYNGVIRSAGDPWLS